MDEPKAMNVLNEFKALAKKHGVWITTVMEEKPDLKWIRIQEISIKVEGDK